MNFFKRAMYSVTRRKGKSLILFAVIFILGNVMAGAISIKQGTKSVEETIKKQLGATATVSFDYEKMEKSELEDYDKVAHPTPDIYNEIGVLSQVKYFDYSVTDFEMTQKLKSVQPKDESFSIGMEGQSYMNFKGVNYPEVIDVKSQKIKMTNGRVFTEEEVKEGKAVAIISEELAKENNLAVGDKMIVDRTVQDDEGMMNSDGEEASKVDTATKDYPMEVIGTFQVVQVEDEKKRKKEDDGMADFNLYEQMNTIYAPNAYISNTAKEFTTFAFEKFPNNYSWVGEEGKQPSLDDVLKAMTGENNRGTSMYIIEKPELVEDFRIEAQKVLDSHNIKYYKVLASSDQYDSVAGPVKGMAKISNLVLIISVVASVLIITLVVILFLRDRKHELGVYLSLGEKRSRVVGQIVTEVVLISLVAITISVFTGNMLAKGFSNSLIQTQRQEDVLDGGFMMGGDWEISQLTNNTVTEDDVVEAYKITLTPQYIALFYVVGLGVVLLSAVAPLIYIMRLNPKKIMM